jgi:hypothetical protein
MRSSGTSGETGIRKVYCGRSGRGGEEVEEARVVADARRVQGKVAVKPEKPKNNAKPRVIMLAVRLLVWSPY